MVQSLYLFFGILQNGRCNSQHNIEVDVLQKFLARTKMIVY